eukprot:c1650_g1_i1.p1 GENE.c1650_g1_i1~~c1650_g1_i1.p1  ORF type:complete len:273 (-),score=64.25 c1650_g1_i1:231-1049(-)
MSDTSETRVLEWIGACSEALDRAETWTPVASSKRGARVYAGMLPQHDILSFMWALTLNDDEDGNVWNKLIEVFHGEKVAEHMVMWDKHLSEVHILKRIPDLCDGADLVYYVLNARPLWQRDLLFLNVMRRSEDGNQIIFAYPTISNDEAWTKYNVNMHELQFYESSHAGSKPIRKTSHRVRGENLMPTCDRITKLGNGKIRVEHIGTTALKGWVPRVAMNTLLRRPIVAAFKQEADLFRDHMDATVHKQSGTAAMVLGVADEMPHPTEFVRD